MASTTSKKLVSMLLGKRIVPLRVELVQPTGSINAALMLGQCIYWQRIAEEEGRSCFWKTRVDWRRELGMTRHQQDSARKNLIDRGLVAVDYTRDNTASYRVNWDQLVEVLESPTVDDDLEDDAPLPETDRDPSPGNRQRVGRETSEGRPETRRASSDEDL